MHDALIIGLSLEPVQRRVGSIAEQREVRGRGFGKTKRDEFTGTRAEIIKLVLGHQQIDQCSPEWCNESRCFLVHSGLA